MFVGIFSNSWNTFEMRFLLSPTELLLRIFFYLLNRNKTLSIHHYFSFWKEEAEGKSQRRPSWVNIIIEAWLWFCFWPKTHVQASMLGAKPMIEFSTIQCVSEELLRAQSAHNFKRVFLIDSTTLWHEFMMHHAIAIGVSKTFAFHRTWHAFLSWLFWSLPLGCIGFGFVVIAINSWFVKSYEIFKQICTVFES